MFNDDAKLDLCVVNGLLSMLLYLESDVEDRATLKIVLLAVVPDQLNVAVEIVQALILIL